MAEQDIPTPEPERLSSAASPEVSPPTGMGFDPQPDVSDPLDELRSSLSERFKQNIDRLGSPDTEETREERREAPAEERREAPAEERREAPPEKWSLAGREWNRPELEQAIREYEAYRQYAPAIQGWWQLEQIAADRVGDPRWQEAFQALFAPDWAERLEITDEEAEEESDDWLAEPEASPEASPSKVSKAPGWSPPPPPSLTDLPPEVSQAVGWAQASQKQAAAELASSWVSEFKERYPDLADDASMGRLADWIEANSMFVGPSGEQGWWRADMGNPLEVAAAAVPELRSRLIPARRPDVSETSKNGGVESRSKEVSEYDQARRRLLRVYGTGE